MIDKVWERVDFAISLKRISRLKSRFMKLRYYWDKGRVQIDQKDLTVVKKHFQPVQWGKDGCLL